MKNIRIKNITVLLLFILILQIYSANNSIMEKEVDPLLKELILDYHKKLKNGEKIDQQDLFLIGDILIGQPANTSRKYSLYHSIEHKLINVVGDEKKELVFLIKEIGTAHQIDFIFLKSIQKMLKCTISLVLSEVC